MSKPRIRYQAVLTREDTGNTIKPVVSSARYDTAEEAYKNLIRILNDKHSKRWAPSPKHVALVKEWKE